MKEVPTWGRHGGGWASPEEECVHEEALCSCLTHKYGEGTSALEAPGRPPLPTQTIGDRGWMRAQMWAQSTSNHLSREAGRVPSLPPSTPHPRPQRFYLCNSVHTCLINPLGDSQVQPGVSKNHSGKCSEGVISGTMAGRWSGDSGQRGAFWTR